jgi:large repetitive protein
MKKYIIGATAIVAILSTSFVTFAQNAPGTATNNATVSSPTTDPNLTNNTATVVDKICYEVDIYTTITDSATLLAPLANNVYTATIGNKGPSAVTELKFTYSYDERDYATLGALTPTEGTITQISTALVGTTRTIEYKLSGIDLATGENLKIAIPVTATANPSNSANLIDPITGNPVPNGQSRVLASFKATPTGPANNDPTCTIKDTVLADNASSDTTDTQIIADMSIIKTSTGGSTSTSTTQGKFISGTAQVYTLVALNNGPSTAGAPITIVDTLPLEVIPTNVTGTSCTPGAGSTAGLTCSYDASTRKMTFILPSALPNGSTITVKIPVTVK